MPEKERTDRGLVRMKEAAAQPFLLQKGNTHIYFVCLKRRADDIYNGFKGNIS